MDGVDVDGRSRRTVYRPFTMHTCLRPFDAPLLTVTWPECASSLLDLRSSHSVGAFEISMVDFGSIKLKLILVEFFNTNRSKSQQSDASVIGYAPNPQPKQTTNCIGA